MIKIESIPYSTIQYYSGTYSEKSEWQDEVDIVEYPFTIISRWNDQIPLGEQITWMSGFPKNKKIIEEQILEKFLTEMLGVDVGLK